MPSPPETGTPPIETPVALSPLKPKLRGWLHLGAAPFALLGGLALMILAPTIGLRAAVAVYMLSSLALFGTSAVYHRGTWTPRVSAGLRRADHANIFIFIAGTYTPLTVALLDGVSRIVLLSVVWGVAALGLTFRMIWLTAPRWLYTVLYVLLGWVAIGWLAQFWATGGPAIVILLLAGGAFYSLGAVAYALKRPNPLPNWFGFHEVFHLGTILAAACHYAAILLAILA